MFSFNRGVGRVTNDENAPATLSTMLALWNNPFHEPERCERSSEILVFLRILYPTKYPKIPTSNFDVDIDKLTLTNSKSYLHNFDFLYKVQNNKLLQRRAFANRRLCRALSTNSREFD